MAGKGKTLKLIHTNNKSELLENPSDIVRKNILEELSFSPQAKRKAREEGIWQSYIHLQNEPRF